MRRKNSQPTIRDLAREVGVSINTVSRALNDKPDVSPVTKERILEASRRLGYRPNKLARGLRARKTQRIGVIVTDIANPFFAAVIKGVEEAAREHHYSLILQDTGEDCAREEEAIQLMLAEQVDGVLITPTQVTQKTILDLKESGLPFVLLGRYFADLRVDYVVTDDVLGGFLATQHLIEQGYQKISLINGPTHISSAKERFEGYCKALAQYRIKLEDSLVSVGAITMEDGYNMARSLLGQRPHPRAVFAYSDFVGLGVMRAIREAGLRVPEDIAVIGYDDIEFSKCLEVPLSTVRIPKRALGRKAVEVLDQKISQEGIDGNQGTRLPVQLVIRQSTCPKQTHQIPAPDSEGGDT